MADKVRKFKLLKDSPEIKAGEIFELKGIPDYGNIYAAPKPSLRGNILFFFPETVENNPDWFEEVFEVPLGITPRKFHIEGRIKEIQDAMERYKQANMDIPAEWTKELEVLGGWNLALCAEKKETTEALLLKFFEELRESYLREVDGGYKSIIGFVKYCSKQKFHFKQLFKLDKYFAD